MFIILTGPWQGENRSMIVDIRDISRVDGFTSETGCYIIKYKRGGSNTINQSPEEVRELIDRAKLFEGENNA